MVLLVVRGRRRPFFSRCAFFRKMSLVTWFVWAEDVIFAVERRRIIDSARIRPVVCSILRPSLMHFSAKKCLFGVFSAGRRMMKVVAFLSITFFYVQERLVIVRVYLFPFCL